MAGIHPQIRCYIPLTADQARLLHEEGAVAGELVAFVVTESVRRSDPNSDDDAWEWAALQDAAAYCQQEGQPVLVAAADVGRDTIDDSGSTGSRVTVHGPVALPRIASLHLGDDLVGETARVSDDVSVVELSWYDATELADVRTLL